MYQPDEWTFAEAESVAESSIQSRLAIPASYTVIGTAIGTFIASSLFWNWPSSDVQRHVVPNVGYRQVGTEYPPGTPAYKCKACDDLTYRDFLCKRCSDAITRISHPKFESR